MSITGLSVVAWTLGALAALYLVPVMLLIVFLLVVLSRVRPHRISDEAPVPFIASRIVHETSARTSSRVA